MTRTRAWPMRVMYLLIAAALVISLIIVAAPAQKVSAADSDVDSEWSRVSTPTVEDWVLAPESEILDYAVADGGEVAYAVVYAWNEAEDTDGYWLLKSDDSAATWKDITSALEAELDENDPLDDMDDDFINELIAVATDGVDSDFVAVALSLWDDSASGYYLHVFISTDGGATFDDTGEVEDSGVYFPDSSGYFGFEIGDFAVSPEVAGTRDIAICGTDWSSEGLIFRCTVTGGTAGAWVDATGYDGWDDDGGLSTSYAVTDVEFAPSWAADKTILVTTVVPDSPWTIYLQSGTWGTTKGWNAQSTVAIDAVKIIEDVCIPFNGIGLSVAGLTLPLDYSGRNSDKRYVWVWVNYYDCMGTGYRYGQIFRVKNKSVMPINQQIEDEPWLNNVDYMGYIAEGKAVAGVMGVGTPDDSGWPYTTCCEGVQVYRNDQITNMDICCLPWESACKPPTGIFGMEAFYVSDDKAYAVAKDVLGDGYDEYFDQDYDESAWSVSFDDGDTWNQLSLVDTYISYISDVAVSPDCNKTFLVTVNDGYNCGCDSVWLYAETLPEAEEYSGQWLRTWCGELLGVNDSDMGHSGFPWVPERGLLRLNPEETTGDTVYLVDRMSDTVYWNEMETLACWDQGASTLDHIVDLAVKDKETIYALDNSGNVAMSDDFAIGWYESVESEVDAGWTIVLKGDNILVGGQDGDVSYSDDAGETFTALEDVSDYSGAHVTVAFDSYFDSNDTIFAALANADEDNGIYLLVIGGDSANWYKTNAEDFNYTGLVLDRPSPGNPMTSAETGGVLYASFYAWWSGDGNDQCCDTDGCYWWYSGVARCLTPIVEICCGGGESEWDYLVWGLVPAGEGHPTEFVMAPQALKICGCLTADSNSHLFAIDGWVGYDMAEGQDGTVWTFEDCYAKKAVDITSPVDGFVVPADPCTCGNVPFTVKWDRLCDACSYDIQFALDEDFEEAAFTWWDISPDAPITPSLWIDANEFTCEFTYYYRVRVADAETCQWIHSWWSEPRSFTVAPSVVAAQINLVSPKPGATDVATTGVGFSWNLMASADNFDWVLSKNADLSSPIESKTGLTNTAYACTKTLTNDTTYYWQVTAYKEGSAISTSAVGTFRTLSEAEETPVTPVEKTPFWVWVVIAIGAVLVIVVIVLIFRTRRV